MALTESVVDVPLDWYQASMFSETIPPLSFIDNTGGKAFDSPLHVLLEYGHYDDLLEIRDYLQDRGCKFRLFGRYGLTRCDYQIKKRFVGLNFSFEMKEESCLFKIFWGGRMF